MTTVTIRQPGFMPHIGFFKKIQSSDSFVYLDDAQYAIRSWDNRNKIRSNENSCWISVPVIHPFGKDLNEVEISYSDVGYVSSDRFKNFTPNTGLVTIKI